MGTMGAIANGDKTLMLMNLDRAPAAERWAFLPGSGTDHRHFALLAHGRQGVDSGLNEAGLALQTSGSRHDGPDAPGRDEPGTVLHGQVLAACRTVAAGVAMIEAHAQRHPGMLGGHVMLAEAGSIAVIEYPGGRAVAETTANGYLARADHSLLGAADEATADRVVRYERMVEFLQELYAWFPALDSDDVVARCRTFLRQEPVLSPHTSTSLVMDVDDRRVHYMVGEEAWRVFDVAEQCRPRR